MSNNITMTASFDSMTIQKNDRSVDLSFGQATDLYYQIGETFYGVHHPSEEWEFPRMRIAGEIMTPTEIEGFLYRFSEALLDFEVHMAVLEEVHRYDWEGQGLLDDEKVKEVRVKVDWLKEGF